MRKDYKKRKESGEEQQFCTLGDEEEKDSKFDLLVLRFRRQ